jgi:two-component system response regulator MprA
VFCDIGRARRTGSRAALLLLKSSPSRSTTTALAASHASPRAQILIVDDDVTFVEGLAAFLEEAGCEVALARDGKAALDQLRIGLRPYVILLDLMMPGMNGWDFRRAQLKDDGLKDIPVVIMTSVWFRQSSLKSELRVVEILSKPFAIGALLAVVGRCRADSTHPSRLPTIETGAPAAKTNEPSAPLGSRGRARVHE